MGRSCRSHPFGHNLGGDEHFLWRAVLQPCLQRPQRARMRGDHSGHDDEVACGEGWHRGCRVEVHDLSTHQPSAMTSNNENKRPDSMAL